MMTEKLIKAAAWLALAAILFATLSPIGLRPDDLMPVNYDRALAFTVMTALFVLAYPRQWLWVGVALVLGSAAIEMMQMLSPTRHARVDDAMVKAAGAAIGIVVGWVLTKSRQRWMARQTLRPTS